MTITPEELIDQKVGGVYHPLLTVRPRYAYDQRKSSATRGRRARMRVIAPGLPKTIKGSGGVSSDVYKKLVGNGLTSFLITNISYGFSEKTQINETFGDSITVMAFGASPVVLNISGVVTDDLDNDWFVRLIYAYKDYIRATKLAKNFQLVRLDMPNASFIGSVLNLNVSQESSNDAIVPFSMQFLVRSYQFYSAQGFDKDLLNSEKPLEAVGTDGTMTMKTIQEMKANSAKLGKLEGMGGYIGELAKSFPAIGGFANSVHGIVDVGNKISESDFVKKAIDIGQKVEGAADAINLVKRGLNEYKKVTDTKPHTGRTYTLSVIGTYSAALDNAGEEDAVTDFLGETKRSLDYLSGVIDTITKSKAGKFLLKGKNLDKSKKLIKDIKSLSKIVGVVKKMADPFNGIISQGVAVLDRLKEVGQAFAGKAGAVTAIPTTSIEKMYGNFNNFNNPMFTPGAADAMMGQSKPSLDEVLTMFDSPTPKPADYVSKKPAALTH